jgi:long-chain fatty acid transport protein
VKIINHIIRFRVIVIFLFMLVNISSSYAGGLILYEQGTYGVGLASAGWAARGQDAGTLFRNPAAMSLLKNSQFMLGAQALYGDFSFLPGPETTIEGNNGGNPIGAIPGGSLFYVHKTTEKLNLGLGVFSYFGLSQEYDEGWVGRYYLMEATLIGLTIMPSVSYRFSDIVSLGLGVNVMYGILDQSLAFNNLLPQEDGVMTVNSSTWGVGVNIGALFEINSSTRFGIDYLSNVDLNFKDTPKFTGMGSTLEDILDQAGVLNAKLDLGISVPHMIMASGYHDINDDVAVMGNIGWQNWKNFGMLDITVSTDQTNSLTADIKFKDTWHIAGGVEWKMAEKLNFTGGLAYDSSPVSDEDRPIALPLGKTIRVGVGAKWKISNPLTLGIAYELAYMGDLSVDQDKGLRTGWVEGTFENSALHFFALNLVWDIF